MLQVTPAFCESPITVAVNCWLPPDGTEAVPGATFTATKGMMIVAEAELAWLAVEAAVTVTSKLLDGRVGGAVYVVGCWFPVAVGETPPHELEAQLTAQVTPSSPRGAPTTDAESCAVAPACRMVGADMVTVIGCCGLPPPHPTWLTKRSVGSATPMTVVRLLGIIISSVSLGDSRVRMATTTTPCGEPSPGPGPNLPR
jgi:hypothetical protein